MESSEAEMANSPRPTDRRKYSGRGEKNESRFRKRDLTIVVEDSNAEPERKKSQSNKSATGKVLSPKSPMKSP